MGCSPPSTRACEHGSTSGSSDRSPRRREAEEAGQPSKLERLDFYPFPAARGEITVAIGVAIRALNIVHSSRRDWERSWVGMPSRETHRRSLSFRPLLVLGRGWLLKRRADLPVWGWGTCPVLRGSWGRNVGQKSEEQLPLGLTSTVPVLVVVVAGVAGLERASALAFPLPPKRGLGSLLGSEIGPFSNVVSESDRYACRKWLC